MPEIVDYPQVTNLIPGLFVISPIRFPISSCFSVKYGLQFSVYPKKPFSNPVKAHQSKRFFRKALKSGQKHS